MEPLAAGYLPPGVTQVRQRIRRWAEREDTKERRSGLDRRLGAERRWAAPGSSREQINLRLFGERRSGLADRRSGFDRRCGIDRRR
jgi:hypothetical protein